MKNKLTFSVLCALLAFAFASCSSDDSSNSTPGEKVYPKVTATMNGPLTRATDASWEQGDQIGITMLYKDSRDIVGNDYNYLYRADDETGTFLPGVQHKAIYFPQEGSLVTFKAYYPYVASLANDLRIPVDLSSQTSLPAIDLMTAEHTSGESKSDRTVVLKFYHRLSKAVVKLRQPVDQPAIDLTKVTMEIGGMMTSAIYDMMVEDVPGSQPLTVDSGSGKNIAVPYMNSSATFDAIVMPRAAGQGVVFNFTDEDGGKYTALMDPSLVLQSGYKYIFDVTLSKTPITVSATIADWLTGEELPLNTLISGTTPDPNVGVTNGDVMEIFTGAGPDRPKLTQFTYDGPNDRWNGDAIYWDNLENPTTFYASILRTAATAGTNQQDERLVATPTVVSRGNAINLSLSYPVAKVIIEIASLDGSFTAAELAAMSVSLPDYVYGGSFANGVYNNGSSRGDITPTTDTNGFHAIIQAQNVPAGQAVVRVTTGDSKVYDLKYASQVTYPAGIATKLLIDMKRTPALVSAQVTDWTDGDEYDMNTLIIGAIGLDNNVKVNNGDAMQVFTGNSASRTLLETFTYNGTQWTGGPVYWDNLSDPTTFYASILRTTAPANTNQQDERLTAQPYTARAGDAVNFRLSYPVAKAIVQLQSSDGSFTAAELAAMQAVLPNYIYDGSFVNGVFVGGSQRANITTSAVGVASTAIIEPQTITAGTTVVRINTGSASYDLKYTADVAFIAGVSTVLAVDMKRTPGMLSATVVDWEQGNTIPFTPTPIQIEGTVGTNSSFFNGKTIYVYKYSNGTPAFEQFTYSLLPTASGGYAWSGIQLYWDNYVGQEMDVTGIYYPSQSRIPSNITGSTATIPWNLPASQSGGYSDLDILTSTLSIDTPSAVNFRFVHPLSKVQVKLVSDEFQSTELQGARVVLNNMWINGDIKMSDGTATSSGAAAPSITPQTDKEGSEYSALVMPGTLTAGTTAVTVTLVGYPNSSFAGTLTSDLILLPGKQHTITVTLKKTKIELSATVEDWTDGDGGTIIIE